MDTVFSILQGLLGLAFVGAGAMHLRATGAASPPQGMEWIAAVPTTGMRAIAVLEVVGGIALLGTLVVAASALSALTAACVLVLMVLAAVFHARRKGEVPNIVLNAILGVLAAVVLYANLT